MSFHASFKPFLYLAHVTRIEFTETVCHVFIVANCELFFLWQARGEVAVRQEFPEATILRPATFFGHEDRFLNYYACEFLLYTYG